jgi:hypothetical protein
MQYKVEHIGLNDIKVASESILRELYPVTPKTAVKPTKDTVTVPTPPAITFPKSNQPVIIGKFFRVSFVGIGGGEADDTYTFWNKAIAIFNRKTRRVTWTHYGGGLSRSASVGDINPISWGETIGLYPTNGEKLYSPEYWTDLTKIDELLRCRKAVSVVGIRNTAVHSVTPSDISGIIAKIAPYHVKSNFPALDPEIADEAVKFFYLSSSPTTITPSIDSRYHTPVIVKAYGPFYNTGGGDAPKGDIYIIFYKAVPKKSK